MLLIPSWSQDWKLPALLKTDRIGGRDAAGVVQVRGPFVREFAKGDRVAAFTDVNGGDRYVQYRLGPKLSRYSIDWPHFLRRTGTYAKYTVSH